MTATGDRTPVADATGVFDHGRAALSTVRWYLGSTGEDPCTPGPFSPSFSPLTRFRRTARVGEWEPRSLTGCPRMRSFRHGPPAHGPSSAAIGSPSALGVVPEPHPAVSGCRPRRLFRGGFRDVDRRQRPKKVLRQRRRVATPRLVRHVFPRVEPPLSRLHYGGEPRPAALCLDARSRTAPPPRPVVRRGRSSAAEASRLRNDTITPSTNSGLGRARPGRRPPESRRRPGCPPTPAMRDRGPVQGGSPSPRAPATSRPKSAGTVAAPPANGDQVSSRHQPGTFGHRPRSRGFPIRQGGAQPARPRRPRRRSGRGGSARATTCPPRGRGPSP